MPGRRLKGPRRLEPDLSAVASAKVEALAKVEGRIMLAWNDAIGASHLERSTQTSSERNRKTPGSAIQTNKGRT